MKLLKTTLVIILLLSLNACGTIPIAYNCPKIVLPPDPIIPISKLTDKSKPNEVVKAWIATATAYRDWNRIVRKQVEEM